MWIGKWTTGIGWYRIKSDFSENGRNRLKVIPYLYCVSVVRFFFFSSLVSLVLLLLLLFMIFFGKVRYVTDVVLVLPLTFIVLSGLSNCHHDANFANKSVLISLILVEPLVIIFAKLWDCAIITLGAVASATKKEEINYNTNIFGVPSGTIFFFRLHRLRCYEIVIISIPYSPHALFVGTHVVFCIIKV